MSRISVLVAAISPDLQADGIAAAVAQRDDMTLVENRVIGVAEVGDFLESLPLEQHCALVLVGPHARTAGMASAWLARRTDLVVLRVAIADSLVHIDLQDASLHSVLDAVRELVERGGMLPDERVSQMQLPAPLPPSAPILELTTRVVETERLLTAARNWVHVLLRAAVARLIGSAPGQAGFSVTGASIVDYLADRALGTALLAGDSDVEVADKTLTDALEAADPACEPLAAAERSLGLSATEFRMLVLALAPELDERFQRWITLLMDDAGRRVGTLGLYAELLGAPDEVGRDLLQSGQLARWRLLEDHGGSLPAADEPLRLDAPFRSWLLGATRALADDPSLRRVLRTVPWPDASLIGDAGDRDHAKRLISRLQDDAGPPWIVLASDNPAASRAHVEAGAADLGLHPIRVDLAQLKGLDCIAAEDAGIRTARLARISGRPLAVDASGLDQGHELDEAVRAFFTAASAAGRVSALIAGDPARVTGLLGAARYELEVEAFSPTARVSVLRAAAAGAGAHFTEEAAESLANLYPLQIDGLERAMRLALATPLSCTSEDAARDRFVSACKQVSAAGASGLAERIEPIFNLDDVILPADRKGQLEEIVDNVRFAPKVLDGWKFRDQLPYGRGVTALFHGPSGTGKTMAAMAVARTLGVQILRIDLSRVVSKYIGETEKNIDRVFLEAQHSGAALVIDEADGLAAKRSEVKDAHDRYANMEVAYLLQRMEAYDGLAILTTNFRQNLDAAFLRRLRFIVDFPRPDASAREEIWRHCLPEESHCLDDAAFRQLGRKIELTGGNIRQVTLRAAFLAAAAGTRIGPEHIAHACRAEFAKLGLPPVEVDLAEKRRAA